MTDALKSLDHTCCCDDDPCDSAREVPRLQDGHHQVCQAHERASRAVAEPSPE